MQLSLGNLAAENFQSFKNLTLDFNSIKGLSTLIMGDNRDDEFATSNGSGKSVVLEAISWVLFGTTFRPLRYADEVINLQENSCMVRLDVSLDGRTITIIRTRAKGKSTVLSLFEGNGIELMADSDSRSKQAQLESLLGFNFQTFTNSIMFHLDYVAFPELKPAERAEILTNIGNLDVYVKAAAQAKNDSSQLDTLMRTAVTKIESAQNFYNELAKKDYDTEIEKWEESKREKIRTLRFDIIDLKEEKADDKDRYLGNIETTNSIIADLEGEIEEKNEKLKVLTEGLHDEIEKNETREKQLIKEETAVASEIHSLKNEVWKHNQEIEKMKKYKGGKCPTCHQEITAEHVDACANELLKKVTDTTSQIDEKNALYQRLRASNAALKDELSKYKTRKSTAEALSKEVAKLDNTLTREKGNLTVFKSKLDNLEKNLAAMIAEKEKQLKTVREEVNPYIELKKEQQESMELKQLEIKDYEKEIEGLIEEQNYLNFYVDGFKKIKLMLFDDLVGRLNELTQEYLSRYTSELAVQVSCERQTKTGTKDEVHIEVERPEGSISYAAYSGGERQKIKLSVSLALAQVIEEMCDRYCNAVFFDEPNNGLDNTGKRANFEILADLANQGNTVVVIDHDAYFQDSFDNVMTVVKEGGYSRLEMGA